MKELRLLELDGVGNILLGLPLLIIPKLVAQFLGLTADTATFFPTVLGTIFVGIGLALLIERFKPAWGGLGLGGAITINLIFGIVLAGWLLFSGLKLSSGGSIVMWLLVLILIGISVVETISLGRRKSGLRH